MTKFKALYYSILNFFRQDTNLGVARNPRWSKVSKEFIKGKVCAMTGTKKGLNVHHILPVWLFPEEEMKPSNWIVLSNKKTYGVKPHQFLGHYGNYKRYNPEVVKEAAEWYNILKGE